MSTDITVEFTYDDADIEIIANNSSGGLEMLFNNQRKHSVKVPNGNVGSLIDWLCKNLMTDSRKDMFVLDDTVRPGVLVLINDADWELEGQESYELQPRDNIVFVSTLHGDKHDILRQDRHVRAGNVDPAIIHKAERE